MMPDSAIPRDSPTKGRRRPLTHEDVAPLFIIGCPRSGTTILLDLLAAHEDFAWVSNWLNVLPELPPLSYANRIYSVPLIGPHLYLHRERSALLPDIREPWVFWSKHLDRFQWPRMQEPPRRHTPEDISGEEISRIRRAIPRLCERQGKQRFLSKYTDHPRMTYLLEALPRAHFVHIVRDGRAVANSLATRMQSGRFHTWEERHWWAQAWPQEWRESWATRHHHPLGLAAFMWKYFVREIRSESDLVPPAQYLEVRYSDLVRSPSETVMRILEFAGLPWTHRMDWYLERRPLLDMDARWREEVPAAQQAELDEIIFEDDLRACLND